jgi:uncharacterized cupredoxin-like copper-binding protein
MRRVLVLPVLVLLLGLTACASDDTKGAIDVTASNDECKVAKTDLKAGSSTFSVKNEGDDVTEVYVYGEGDEVKGEVENIGPGTKRNLTVDLTAGDYEVACKPGMKGDGIRTAISVTGSGGTATAEPTKTVTIEATDYSYDGLDGITFSKGETVEFRLHNEAPEEKHELEVFGPDGDALGEVGPTKPGATGRVVLTLTEAGTYRLNCGIEDHAEMGMKATFTVT